VGSPERRESEHEHALDGSRNAMERRGPYSYWGTDWRDSWRNWWRHRHTCRNLDHSRDAHAPHDDAGHRWRRWNLRRDFELADAPSLRAGWCGTAGIRWIDADGVPERVPPEQTRAGCLETSWSGTGSLDVREEPQSQSTESSRALAKSEASEEGGQAG
jgi:hypothetical protein